MIRRAVALEMSGNSVSSLSEAEFRLTTWCPPWIQPCRTPSAKAWASRAASSATRPSSRPAAWISGFAWSVAFATSARVLSSRSFCCWAVSFGAQPHVAEMISRKLSAVETRVTLWDFMAVCAGLSLSLSYAVLAPAKRWITRNTTAKTRSKWIRKPATWKNTKPPIQRKNSSSAKPKNGPNRKMSSSGKDCPNEICEIPCRVVTSPSRFR
jgi:hypothetical protein